MTTTTHLRTMAAGILALAWVAPAAAQAPAAALLNTLEVQELAARADPGDHARVSAHFAALADRYTAEAGWQAALARGFAGNPNRPHFASAGHALRLAELNRQSAATVRALAEHHDLLASGIASTAPRDGSRFEGGEGAPRPTGAQLAALAAGTRTPAGHRVLEEYYLMLAREYSADASHYATVALGFRGTRIATAAMHYDHKARQARDAASEATAAAETHRQLTAVGD